MQTILLGAALVIAVPGTAQTPFTGDTIVTQEAGADTVTRIHGTYGGTDYSLTPEGPGALSARVGEVPAEGGFSSWVLFSEAPPDWWVTCSTDAMTDERACAVRAVTGTEWDARRDESLIIYVRGDGNTTITIAREKKRHPGSEVAVRVDDGQAQRSGKGGWVGAEARPLRTALEKGTEALTRYTSWPRERTVDRRIRLTHLDVALELAEDFVAGNLPPG